MIDAGELIDFSFTKEIVTKDTKNIDLPPELRDSDYYWRKDKIKSYHYIIGFDVVIILSRIIFQKPSKIKFYYYISLEKIGEHLMMENPVVCQNGAIKMLDFHYFPCKYVHFITLNDKIFPSKETINCFGFNEELFRAKYGSNLLKTIMDKTSKIIYHDDDKEDI